MIEQFPQHGFGYQSLFTDADTVSEMPDDHGGRFNVQEIPIQGLGRSPSSEIGKLYHLTHS
jgi:hypothetical protein